MAMFRAGLQSLINSFEIGGGRGFLRIVLFAVLVIALFGVRIRNTYRGLKTPAAMESAQLARSLAKGEGFVTRCLRPADVSLLGNVKRTPASVAHWPDTRNAPAYPAVLAGVMKIVRPRFDVSPSDGAFAPERTLILPLGIAFTLVSGLLIYLLARKVFGPYAGLMAVLAFFLSDPVLRMALSGTALPMATCLALGATYAGALCLDARLQSKGPAAWVVPLIAAGLLCGAACLTLYSLVALVPLLFILVGAGFERGRLTWLLLLLLLVVLVMLPWCARNVRVSGNAFGTAPYRMLNDSALYRDNGFDCDTRPVLRNAVILKAMRIKLTRNLADIWESDLFKAGSGVIVAFFLLSFFHRFGNPVGNVLRWAVGAGVLGLMVAAALIGKQGPPLLGVLYPLMAVLAAAAFFATVDNIEFLDPAWHPVLMWIVITFAAVPTLVSTFMRGGEEPYPPYFPPFAAYAGQQVSGEELLVTDIPWATAWYGEAPSMLLPRSVKQFQALDASELAVGALYITTETSDRAYRSQLVAGPYRSWLPVINGREPGDEAFRFKHAITLPQGTSDQVLLVPDSRWGEPVQVPGEPAKTDDEGKTQQKEPPINTDGRG